MFLVLAVGVTMLLTVVDCQTTGIGTVAFTAAMDRPTVTGVGPIVFPIIIHNSGRGYSNITGLFTAPKDGVYVFHMHGLSENSKDIWIHLHHNGAYVVSAYGYVAGFHVHTGNTATLSLKKNDIVYVNVRIRAQTIISRTQELYCTFSGYWIGPRNNIQ